jgi:GT2 family glycosyltransferase
MTDHRPDVAIVLFKVRWSEFSAVLSQLAKCSAEFRTLRVLLSGGNAEREQLERELSRNDLTNRSEVCHRFDNLGFASGHNLLLSRSFSAAAPACLVLNPDVLVQEGAIEELTSQATKVGKVLAGPSLSAVQDGRKVVDSLGIVWSSGGRHLDRGQGQPWAISAGRTSKQAGLTGACLLVDAEVFRRLVSLSGHFFDDYFLAYREDAELGVRAAMLQIPSVLVEMNGFSHQRAVHGSSRGHGLADLLGVRNRFLLRWKLGSLRPGAFALPTLRDMVVVVATFSVERRSLPGLKEAFRIRRAMVGRRRRFEMSGQARASPSRTER